jgi:hypothetical protein
LKALAKFGEWSVEIVKRLANTPVLQRGRLGFEVLPRR